MKMLTDPLLFRAHWHLGVLVHGVKAANPNELAGIAQAPFFAMQCTTTHGSALKPVHCGALQQMCTAA